MKALAPFFCCLFFSYINAQPTLPELRRLYVRAGSSEDSAKALDKLLVSVNEHSQPVLLCYKGASKMVSAKYAFSPFKKYHAFVAAKKIIEAAITKDTGNIEMRFLRFTIQTKLPGFLGYNGNIKQDKQYVLAGYKSLGDATMRQMVLNFLKVCGCCTTGEIKSLQND